MISGTLSVSSMAVKPEQACIWVMSVTLKEQVWDFSSFAQACSRGPEDIGILSGYIKSYSNTLELSNEGGRILAK